MYLSKSRHGIYYYRRNGMRKSLNTRIKQEAVLKVAEIITEKPMMTVNHAGAEIIINGDSIEHELALVQALTTTTITAKKVKDVLSLFCQEKMTDGSWTIKTAAENTRIIEHFIKGIGNVTTAKINHEVLNDYKTGLLNSGRNPSTINKYLSRIGTFCGWMERHGYLEKNYAKGLQVKRTKRAQDERERFTLEEVDVLLSNLTFDPKKTWRYWLVVLGYFTGARLNELCQLHCCDVNDGSISVNDDTPDKRLKNEPSRRLIPIHSELIRLGFLEFCDHEGRVFEELTYNSRDGYAKNPSRWFSDYRKSLGIEKPFHSFRHTFTDILKQAMVAPTVIDELTGHALSGESMSRYGKRYGVTVLKKAVELIPASLER